MRRSSFAFLAALPAILALACGSGPDATTSNTTSSSTSAAGGGGGGGTGAAGAGGGGAGGTTTTSTAGGGGAGGTTTTSTTSTGPTNNGFPDHWSDGLSCGSEPEVTIWSYDDDTFILRQSLCTNFEGPFLYLLFGENKVFLQDTGTGDADVAGAVTSIIADWLAKKGKASINLVVTHSHSHGDHIGGDGQFAGLPNTQVVGTAVSDVQGFFGIASWPTQIVSYDLGARSLDIIPIPGHQKAHIAVYDKSRELLLTGDTLYPGRLYISDYTAYPASLKRLTDFTSAPDHPVTWVLGTHIEMTTTPGQDYPMGANKHPSEHALQLTLGTLVELQQAIAAMGGNLQYQVHDDFIIYPL